MVNRYYVLSEVVGVDGVDGVAVDSGVWGDLVERDSSIWD